MGKKEEEEEDIWKLIRNQDCLKSLAQGEISYGVSWIPHVSYRGVAWKENWWTVIICLDFGIWWQKCVKWKYWCSLHLCCRMSLKWVLTNPMSHSLSFF